MCTVLLQRHASDMMFTLMQFAFLAFSGILALWILTIIKAKQGAHTIHYLMGALVGLRALTVLSQSGMYHMIAIYGHPEGWNIAFVSFIYILRLCYCSECVINLYVSCNAVFLHSNEKYFVLHSCRSCSCWMELHETVFG